MTDEQLFNTELLMNAVSIFKNYTLKSLENQTNKNFEIIIMIHDNIDMSHPAIKELLNINSSIPINIIRKSTIKNVISETNNYDFLITSRIDHDDLIYNGAVNDIQQLCNPDIPLFFYGYSNGMTMVNSDINNVYKFYPIYTDPKATCSIFQSLIVNRKILPMCNNTAYMENHTIITDSIKKIYNEYNIPFKDDYIKTCDIEDAFIYIKHDFNHSTYMHPLLNDNWHRTNIKVNNSKDWFTNRFGNFIN